MSHVWGLTWDPTEQKSYNLNEIIRKRNDRQANADKYTKHKAVNDIKTVENEKHMVKI